MNATIRVRAARALRRIARRLDPPSAPYGEWDPAKGVLVIKIPGHGGPDLPLACLEIGAGQFIGRTGTATWPS
ncbi:hypothetical protein [Actinoallomurus sp. NPDC052274]|uniref:hypothetical protein n=1 Tax=Actinoallomurus sp. NPDC052274 TaxID=3155420 RepID=UPI0034205F27